jgi:DNA-binding response OmpR family regulator
VEGGTETILLVEDEEPIRRSATRVLERFGYTVLVAEEGHIALELFRSHAGSVDLVITDVVMPRMGGRALHDRLRGEGHTVPFLFTSGYTARDVRENATLDPGAPFLHKPWNLSELLVKVREVLDRHGVTRSPA